MPKRQVDVVYAPVMRSASMRALDRVLRAVAPKEVIVTLIGESGTGKEVLARRVHELSPRRGGPFMPINCAAIPEALFESELFGHERGAFTGASERTRGKVEASGGGTLFLDEIGELPLTLQAKLLRFLESRKFMRVGGSTKIAVDTRLICATLRPLNEEVRAGRFRADLYYRIQGVTLNVPPLRDRQADIVPLVHQFIVEFSAKHGGKPPRIGRRVMMALLEHDWPGNVRELRNVVELTSLLRPGKQVRLEDLGDAIGQPPLGAPVRAEGVVGEGTLLLKLDEPLDVLVEHILRAALALEGGSRSGAARRLGISVRTVQRHLAEGSRRKRKS